jgi:hypothetical protein
MATRQPSKQAKTKAATKVDTRVINNSVRNGERERRNLRARSRSAAARIDQAGATAAAVVAFGESRLRVTQRHISPLNLGQHSSG